MEEIPGNCECNQFTYNLQLKFLEKRRVYNAKLKKLTPQGIFVTLIRNFTITSFTDIITNFYIFLIHLFNINISTKLRFLSSTLNDTFVNLQKLQSLNLSRTAHQTLKTKLMDIITYQHLCWKSELFPFHWSRCEFEIKKKETQFSKCVSRRLQQSRRPHFMKYDRMTEWTYVFGGITQQMALYFEEKSSTV